LLPCPTFLPHRVATKGSRKVTPNDIPADGWVFNHPLCWQTENFIENFNGVTLATITQEKERIDDTLELLDDVPQVSTDEGASELPSKQHRMWISELLRNSWISNVIADMSAFEEEIQEDGVILFYVFLREHINGEKWYYCSKCFVAHHWNKTHKTEEHKRGAGKNKINDTDKSSEKHDKQANAASYDAGYGADEDFQLG
jgi:hypothetical protein